MEKDERPEFKQIIEPSLLLKTKDDGMRDKYPSGALRSLHEGRGRFDLVSPIGLKRLAIRYEAGGKQKGDRNWELGFPVSRACCSAVGHLYEYLDGDREEDHPAAIAWQMFCVMHFEIMVERGILPRELLDIPINIKVKEKGKHED